MACPAPLNAGEAWTMWDKNKTSHAYPHKIHKAGACKKKKKKDIAHAGRGRYFRMQHYTPWILEMGILTLQVHSVEL